MYTESRLGRLQVIQAGPTCMMCQYTCSGEEGMACRERVS